MLLPVFPQKAVRFRHIDTYGIGRIQRKSIPIVSDCRTNPDYHVGMKQNLDPWKHWGRRLKVHLKENGQNLAGLAEKMTNSGTPIAESTLRSWTNGNRQINLTDFFEICAKAEADPAQILFGQTLMSAEVEQQIGNLAAAVIKADPAIKPTYGKLVGKLSKAGKRLKAQPLETGGTAVATRKPKTSKKP